MTGFETNYSRVDKMLHNLAMGQLELQKSLSALEDRLMQDRVDGVEAPDPVFITSLPRAGTTLLLEVICADPVFVSHTYRNMPFLLCPMIWDRMSRSFRQQATARERAHGDGMTVGFDSVEAFEEIIWRAFWPDRFTGDRIAPWCDDEPSQEGDFPTFLRQHARKLVALARARDGSVAARRYVSKNNANIARLCYLSRTFPDARILVPFRHPMAHVGSLARQHANFLGVHARDGFAKRYMESIGHLEFGEALRPIDFDGWVARSRNLDPLSADFWCEYWIAAFEAALEVPDERLCLFSYDRLCTTPQAGLDAIADFLGLGEDSPLRGQSGRFRPPTAYGGSVAPERMARADALHARLLERCVI